MNKKRSGLKTLAVWLIIGAILFFVIPAILDNTSNKMTYSELIEKANNGEITDIEISYGGQSAAVKVKNDAISHISYN